jgi:hypothetical protein
MQKTNLSKLLPKFIRKGGKEVKDLTQKILDNAAACTKRKQDNEKSANEVSQPKGPLANQPKGDVGLKRPREADGNLQSGTKRMAVTTTNLKDVGKVAPTGNGPTKGAQSSKPASAPALRPKANVVAPKPTSLFGTLSSASKRPGTTNADRAAAAAAAKPKYVFTRVFSISSVLTFQAVPPLKRKRHQPQNQRFPLVTLWPI